MCFVSQKERLARMKGHINEAGKDLLSPERVARVGRRLKLVIGIAVAGGLVRVRFIEDWLQFGRANITELAFHWLNR